MPEMPPVVPVPTGNQPASNGAAPVAPAVDSAAVAAAVAKSLGMPEGQTLPQMIYGTTKRMVSEALEAAKAAQGTAPAAPKADVPEADPATLPLKEQVSRLTAALQERDKQAAKESNLRKSAEVRAALEPLIVPGLAKFVLREFIEDAQRGDDGNYYLKDGDLTLSLLDGFKARMAALPDKGASIMRAGGAAPGSGAGDATTKPAPIAPSGYKSKRELGRDKRTNAKGEEVWEITSASNKRMMDVLSQPGGRAFVDALPDK